jgi:membrane protein required for colicin V production
MNVEFIAQLNWIDGIILIVIVFFALWGLKQGFIQGLLALIIWLVAGTVAYFYTPDFSVYLSKWIQAADVRFYLAFFVIVLGVWIVGGILSVLITSFSKSDHFSFSDRVLGLVLGLIKGIFITSVAVAVLNMSSTISSDKAWQDSQVKPVMLDISSWVESVTPKEMNDRMFQGDETTSDAISPG